MKSKAECPAFAAIGYIGAPALAGGAQFRRVVDFDRGSKRIEVRLFLAQAEVELDGTQPIGHGARLCR